MFPLSDGNMILLREGGGVQLKAFCQLPLNNKEEGHLRSETADKYKTDRTHEVQYKLC